MAITDVPEYAHLSDADVAALAAALEAIRCDIEDSRGAKDREYIRRAIAFQRCLEVAARLTIVASKTKVGLDGRNRRAGRGQVHREHGTRP